MQKLVESYNVYTEYYVYSKHSFITRRWQCDNTGLTMNVNKIVFEFMCVTNIRDVCFY